ISELFAKLNAGKARAQNALKSFGADEAKAEFAAQFTLFSQSVTNALAQADTPEACDEQLARLTMTLEELEGRFGNFDEFLPDIISKREELQDAFDAQRENLLDERQRRAQNLQAAAGRILDGIAKRAQRLDGLDELNTHFTTDPMVVKLKDTATQLRELGDAVGADDLEGRLKAAKDGAVRSLRDKRDLFEGDGSVVKLGSHRFNVNQQALELTLIPRQDDMYVHLTGTGFSQAVADTRLLEYREYWERPTVSESPEVYRGEYLASQVIDAVLEGTGMAWSDLMALLLDEDRAAAHVRDVAAERYTEGYERGVHDHDALRILQAVVPRMDELGLLTTAAPERALALLFWHDLNDDAVVLDWRTRAQTAAQLLSLFPGRAPFERLVGEMQRALTRYVESNDLSLEAEVDDAARYLVRELSQTDLVFSISQVAYDLLEALRNYLRDQKLMEQFGQSLATVKDTGTRFYIASQWLQAFVDARRPEMDASVLETAVLLLYAERSEFRVRAADIQLSVGGLLGQHERLSDGELHMHVPDFLLRTRRHHSVDMPAQRAFTEIKQQVARDLRRDLQLEAFVPRPLSSFVRNKLLNEAYLPIIGDNLAKQLGAADDAKRTDLMGLLLLISPPGYGKTTLMEYVASRLGLIFVKVNGPALGHSVVSIDPQQAPSATSRQELEKLNLAFEMGNNVMLYVDDIQHTNPEFLQKFISLCDGTRRIEGVWRGEPKTYDLRGRRFCVVMAGNPYTESGDVFQIPDMLANRADVYNLGDVLSGREEVFALSYVENSLTSNPVLAPLATRDMDDVYRFVERAAGRTVADSDFKHAYSGAEASEIVTVLQKLQAVQRVVLAVNQEYIRSAAMDELFRTEPPFKLQGSYRNMNKLAEKILPVMN
ncbi:MAG: AAA family ATPase, partial [Pseudomonadota bacterium]